MNIEFAPSVLSGQVEAIPSKSFLHRALICAALSNGESRMKAFFSDDIKATAGALNSLGCNIKNEAGYFHVFPADFRRKALVFCGESGTTLRLLAPAAAALGIAAKFTGEGRLAERPMETLFHLMEDNGVSIEREGEKNLPFSIFGQLKSGKYTLLGNISSQYISGLLLSLPLCGGDSEIFVTPPFESRPYVDLTVDVMRRFGALVHELPDRYLVKSINTYRPFVIDTEKDWSNAAFWLCAGAIGGDVTVTGLSLKSKQGDRQIIEILKSMGADITIGADGIRAKKSLLTGVDIDASQIPDLVPILSVSAAFAKGKTRITGASRLRLKESDRLYTVERVLSALGADIKQMDDGLIIDGKGMLDGGDTMGYNDHRIAMSVAVAALYCRNKVRLSGAECVEKSYPDFFCDYRMLGGVPNEFNMG